MSSPRPILKRSTSDASSQRAHAVHFPPSSSLTRTYSAHSATAYDRSPIIVTPNSCALPEWGCPGRTYGLEESSSPLARSLSRKPGHSSPSNGRDLHPCAAAFKRNCFSAPPGYSIPMESDEDLLDLEELAPMRTLSSLPPLIPDNSSESSEDSDTFGPSSYSSIPFPISNTSLSIPNSERAKPPSFAPIGPLSYANVNALSFLPHPPSPPHTKLTTAQDDQELTPPRPRRTRGDRERSLARRERERTSSSSSDDVEADEAIAAARKTRIGVKTMKMRRAMALASSSSFSSEDDGCLGGF